MARPNVNKLINSLAAQRKARLAAEAGDVAVVTKPAAATKAEPNQARRTAAIANTAGGKAVAKAQAESKKAAKVSAAAAKAEARAAVARVKEAEGADLVAKVADLELAGNVTERLWQLFNAMGTPGTFERKVALEAALAHGLSPASASLAFARWKVQPGTPTAKHLGASKAA